jgi:hypothetical protein
MYEGISSLGSIKACIHSDTDETSRTTSSVRTLRTVPIARAGRWDHIVVPTASLPAGFPEDGKKVALAASR